MKVLPSERIVDFLLYEDAELGYEKICDTISGKTLNSSPPDPAMPESPPSQLPSIFNAFLHG